MRKLIHIPILHTEQDFGQLSAAMNERARAIIGEEHLQKHKQTILLYWRAIAKYWDGKDVSGLKIFQDGMMIGGTVGARIVKDLAEAGSINHKIIELLMEQGAILVKTEDPELLKEEYALTRGIAQKKPLLATVWALLRYQWRKNGLLNARDAYIAQSINESLEEGETGACFLGASHQILPRLSKDIQVVALKNPEKVRAYSRLVARQQWEAVKRLSEYLTLPIGTE